MRAITTTMWILAFALTVGCGDGESDVTADGTSDVTADGESDVTADTTEDSSEVDGTDDSATDVIETDADEDVADADDAEDDVEVTDVSDADEDVADADVTDTDDTSDDCDAQECECSENEDCDQSDACVDGACELACGTVRCAPNHECVHGACLPIDEDARACSVAGGTWRLFPDTCVDACGAGPACGDAETMGCDCGKTACWDGVKCARAVEGESCDVDLDCVDGSVCEPDRDAKLVCARGCHTDEQCDAGQRCDNSVTCLVPPCPGQCTGKPAGIAE